MRGAIYLYVPFSRQDAFKPIRRGPVATVRNRLRRVYDFGRWQLTSTLDTYGSAWADYQNSNVGDAAIVDALIKLAWPYAAELIEVSWGDLTPERVAEINDRGRAVLMAGGYVVVRPDGSISQRVSQDLPAFRQLRVPLIPVGAGINFLLAAGERVPEIAPEHRPVVAEWLRLCARVGLRDRLSVDTAASLGADAELVADPVLVMSAASAARELRPAPVIGVNFAGHRNYFGQNFADVLAVLIEAMARLQQRTGARFVHFMHADSARFVSRALKATGLNVTDIGGRAEDLLPEYAKLDIHIAQMMHSSILSACAGAPFGVLAYDEKNVEFARLLGLASYVTSGTEATPVAIVEMATALLQARGVLAKRMETRLAELRRQQASFVSDALPKSPRRSAPG